MAKKKVKKLMKAYTYASVGALGVSAILWALFPKARKAIAAVVIASPIPPIP
ncbi:MAG: hypothetical protein PHO67_08990 [Candidatus Omnitrophica bacterium]|jgi:hypothetical protein|nr:hypothetical protein [Candidatus Omnitrophota bacterium]